MNILHDGDFLRHRLIQDFNTDAVRLMGDNTVIERCSIVEPDDISPAQLERPHRDGIQLMARITGYTNQQFAAATLTNAFVIDNHIFAQPGSKLQGIFGSDGLFDHVAIHGNVIGTESAHIISLNGLLSGHISDNWEANGERARVYLGPLRIGGQLDGFNIWVVSFRDADDAYQPLEAIMPDLADRARCMDARQWITRQGDAYLYDFELKRYRDAALLLTEQWMPHADEYGTEALTRGFRDLAFQHGTRVQMT